MKCFPFYFTARHVPECVIRFPRISCGAFQFQAVQFTSHTPKGNGKDYFSALGLKRSPSPSPLQIRQAYRRKAMKMHPDVASSATGAREATAAFQEISEAYEILMCDVKRREHEAELDRRARRGGGGEGRDYENGSSIFGDFDDDQGEDAFYRRERRRYESRDRSHPDGWAVELPRVPFGEKLNKEYREAVSHAYWGPYFAVQDSASAPASHMWPWAFEMEERLSPAHSRHVTEIVSGRQLLGKIVEVLPGVLELHWLDNLYATAITRGGNVLVFMRNPSLFLHPVLPLKSWSVSMAPEVRERINDWHLTARITESQTLVTCGKCGRETHQMLKYATPGVKHTVAMDLKSKVIDFKATRAWLPPSKFWLWEPRSQAHSKGGQYIERYTARRRRGGKLRIPHADADDRQGKSECNVCSRHGQAVAALDPCVFLLDMAYEQLAKEKEKSA